MGQILSEFEEFWSISFLISLETIKNGSYGNDRFKDNSLNGVVTKFEVGNTNTSCGPGNFAISFGRIPLIQGFR